MNAPLNSRSKSNLLLLLVALVATLGLGWFAWQSMSGLEVRVQQNLQAFEMEQISAQMLFVDQTLAQVDSELLAQVPPVSDFWTANDFQQLRSLPLVQAALVLDSAGALLFPQSPWSMQDSAFIRSTRLLWQGRALVDMSGAHENVASNSKVHSSSLLALAAHREKGWITWYWEDGMHLLFWMRRGHGVIALEVGRIPLLSRIVGNLPENTEQPFSLVDEAGAVLHQYGVANLPKSASILGNRNLPLPLQSWNLQHYGDSISIIQELRKNEWKNWLWKLLLPFLMLMALGFWAYREGSRTLREARTRVDFVNQVSHELKTPLANIRLYAELLENAVEEGDQEKLKVIQSESERLSRMIHNILTFSRKERRKLQLSRVPVSLDDLVRESVDVYALRMSKRGLAVRIYGYAPRSISLDPDATRQILANLLGNAEKYAAQGQFVDIYLEQENHVTTLAVQDHGPGIPEEFRQKIFEAFYRMDNRLEEGVSGTGIGLHISRTLAELQESTLELEASSEGARFVWRIPQ